MDALLTRYHAQKQVCACVWNHGSLQWHVASQPEFLVHLLRHIAQMIVPSSIYFNDTQWCLIKSNHLPEAPLLQKTAAVGCQSVPNSAQHFRVAQRPSGSQGEAVLFSGAVGVDT